MFVICLQDEYCFNDYVEINELNYIEKAGLAPEPDMCDMALQLGSRWIQLQICTKKTLSSLWVASKVLCAQNVLNSVHTEFPILDVGQSQLYW